MDDGSAPLKYGKVCKGGCASCLYNGGSYNPPTGNPPGSCTYPQMFDEHGNRRALVIGDYSLRLMVNERLRPDEWYLIGPIDPSQSQDLEYDWDKVVDKLDQELQAWMMDRPL